MEYTIIKNTENIFLIQIKDKYKVALLTNWSPDSKFQGLAVRCSYDVNGNPIGILKDNNLDITQVYGKPERPVFEINRNVFQAGPTLIQEGKPKKFNYYKKEGFSSGEIKSGEHCHIGIKKNGDVLVGWTKDYTLSEIIRFYEELSAEYVIKLPGHNKTGFLFCSKIQKIQKGEFKWPAALVFEKS